MTLFVDDDGTAYLLHSSEDNWTLYIAELNEDYTGLTGAYSRNYVDRGGSKGVYAREAPAIFKENGSYYLITSGCTGWNPNQMGYSVTDNIREGMSEDGGNGPFQMDDLKNPCVGTDADISFGGQSTFVLQVANQDGCYIYMGDKWNSKNLKDSRYQWLPIQIDSEEKALTISWSDEWKLKDFESLNSEARTALNRAVREADALSAAEYDFGQKRWEELQELLSEAKNLSYSADASEMTAKTAAIETAVSEVKRWSVLDAALARVENSAEAEFTQESWKMVADAYEAAQALGEDASAEEIARAAQAIADAMEELVTVEMTTEELELTGKAVAADTYHSGNEAEKAIDGDADTFWHCEYGNGATPLPHYLTIDLGEPCENLYQLNYLPRQDKDSNGIATKYRILVSGADKELSGLEDSDFTEVRTGVWEEDKTEKTAVFRTESAVRFVRFEIVEGVGDLASAAEIRLLTGTPKDDGSGGTGDGSEDDGSGGDENGPGNESGDGSGGSGGNGSENDGDGKQTEQTPQPGENPGSEIKAEKLAIKAESQRIAPGRKVKLSVSVSPENASNPAVEWKSGNRKYATVNSQGVVTTKKAGKGKTVIITATAKDGSGVKASIRIKIMKNSVTKVAINRAPKTLKAGQKLTLKATVRTDGKKANRTLKWKSSNPSYASVTNKGKVTAKKAGKGKTVTITAASTDGTNKKAKIRIKIK